MRIWHFISSVTGAKLLQWASFAAASLLTATAEHDLMVVLGSNDLIAWAFPVMLDCYCMRAFMSRSKGNVIAAIGLMIVSQIIAHLLSPHTSSTVHPAFVIVLSCVPPVILWRIHHLDDQAHAIAPAFDADALLAELEAARDRAAALAAERDHHAADALRLTAEILNAEGKRVQAEQRAATAEEQLAATEEQPAAATVTARTSGRSAEENFRMAQEIRSAHPGITTTEVAARLGLTRQRLGTIEKQFATV